MLEIRTRIKSYNPQTNGASRVPCKIAAVSVNRNPKFFIEVLEFLPWH
jgi:hypothetical protein